MQNILRIEYEFILVIYVDAFKKTSLNDTHYETTSGENIHHFPVPSFLVWRDKRQRLLLHPRHFLNQWFKILPHF